MIYRSYRVTLIVDVEIGQHEDSADWETVEAELDNRDLWEINHDLGSGYAEEAYVDSFVEDWN